MTKRIKAKTSVNDGWVQPKPRKSRKPMTPEQKAAAAERLAKARAAKGTGIGQCPASSEKSGLAPIARVQSKHRFLKWLLLLLYTENLSILGACN